MIVEDLGMYEDRIQSAALRGQVMSTEDAARLIKSGMTIGTSGFTRIGYPKAVSLAIAELGTARDLTVICGASVGDELDGSLARSGQMKRRYAFQTNNDLRARINSGDVLYTDIHLGRVTQALRRGEFGKVDVAILECCLIHEDGSFVPTLSVGLSMALADCAEKVILELNLNHPVTLEGHFLSHGYRTAPAGPHAAGGGYLCAAGSKESCRCRGLRHAGSAPRLPCTGTGCRGDVYRDHLLFGA